MNVPGDCQKPGHAQQQLTDQNAPENTFNAEAWYEEQKSQDPHQHCRQLIDECDTGLAKTVEKTTVPNSFPKNKKIPIQNIPMRSPKRIVYSIEREIRCSLPRDCSSEMVGSSMADREKVTAFGNIRKDRDMPVRMP